MLQHQLKKKTKKHSLLDHTWPGLIISEVTNEVGDGQGLCTLSVAFNFWNNLDRLQENKETGYMECLNVTEYQKSTILRICYTITHTASKHSLKGLYDCGKYVAKQRYFSLHYYYSLKIENICLRSDHNFLNDVNVSYPPFHKVNMCNLKNVLNVQQ